MLTTKRWLSVYLVAFLLVALLTLVVLVYAGVHTLQAVYPLRSIPWTLKILEGLPLLVAFVFWAISLGVWIFHHRHQVTRLFFLTSQVIAALLALKTMPAFDLTYTSWDTVLFSLLFIAVAPLALHFFTLFPAQIPTALRRYLLIPAYGIALLLAGMFLFMNRGPLPSRKFFQELTRVYVAVTFVVALFVAFRYWEGASPRALQYRRLLAMGLILGITPALFLSFIPEILLKTRLVEYPWTLLFLVAVPLTYALALRTGKLGRVDRVLSRTLAHLILSGVFLVIYLVLFWWLDNRFSFMHETSPLVIAGLAVVAAAFFSPVRRVLLHFADRFLYGGWYDYRSTLQELSQRLRGVIRPDDLALLLVDHLSQALRLRGALFLLASEEHLVPVRATGVFEGQSWPPLSTGGHLSEFLVQVGRPVTSEQVRQALSASPLSAEEKMWIGLPNVTLWLPLMRDRRLEGVLLLGGRVSGDPLESEDLRLLNIVAAHAATAVENVRLVESLQARVEEVKRLYAQLALAREEERKRLARELHDVVLQDLINAYVTLDQVRGALGEDNRELFDRSHEQILHTIHTLRRLCTELRPPALDITDLRSAIEGLVDDVRRESDLEITLSFPEGGYRVFEDLSDVISITLFRALQETLANVRRHAQARRVHVEVRKEAGRVELWVEDDGRGFSVPSRLSILVRDQHYGLVGVAERVQAVGGTLDVSSAPGRGTRVRVSIPLQEG